jgi:hypothetical protein
MAARIQAKINAPYKEKRRISSMTVEHVEQQSLKPTSQSRPQGPELAQQGGSSATSELPPPCLEQPTNLSAAVEAKPKAQRSRSKSRARSGDSHDSHGNFSFTSFMPEGSDSEADFPRPKRLRVEIPERRAYTRTSQHTTKVTSTVGADLPSETSTSITVPDIGQNINNNNVDKDGISGVERVKRKLQSDLTRFLKNELDYAGIQLEVIPVLRELYATSPYRTPDSDLYVEFRNFNRALDHWESLIAKVTGSTGITQSLVQDPLQELAAQETFEDRVAKLRNLGPRSHVDFPFESWTVFLALFFEGVKRNSLG